MILAVTKGMRLGGIVGLRWQDVDLDAETLVVTQVTEQTKTGVRTKLLKADRSHCTIVLPTLAVEFLREHRTKQSLQRLSLGSAWQDSDLVASAPDGRVWRPGSLSSAW